MVRYIPGLTTTGVTPVARPADPLTDLTRLLNRLQQTILRADAEREARLRASEYEREKAKANINYARSLLTKLEQEALGVKIHVRKNEIQTDLVRKREIIEQLTERLSDLAEIAAAEEASRHGGAGDNGEDTSDSEDILADIIATPSESLDSNKSHGAPVLGEEEEEEHGWGDDQDQVAEAAPNAEEKEQQPQDQELNEKQGTEGPMEETRTQQPELLSEKQPFPETTTTQIIRPRRQPNNDNNDTAHEKPTAQTTSSSLLPPSTTATSSSQPGTISATAEAILDTQRAEQDALSESILKLATELKASSQAFSSYLEEDKETLERAGEGMNKTEQGMTRVTGKMSTLQRMTEGEGWWGRMMLYAYVYGLMVVLLLVVFVLPKLRF
ncbi:hypothetical protein GE21DRAFT_4480 [Neurospora crassa]|uniref:Synaptobrevin n=1 Tax=Neurospora crassa (strain ATCC 24698 / 74-OR23-1A / CBS 708.71 / DSM 1257 / FGSC 987) TaxID=367110 RepID=Q7RXA3_NEUCR|nr:hypothetical protein NCU00184 [Neurospora crassa OR74A]EAA27171.1 hypothetical protein NCU00184 [Neurospora crassa OR74A]KHE89407.1 hypothetical protein GE21DRAFT_4480 [Neurospora crassa]|eukprot:XP_956407.1 hypothetical protein NCU00184 [Neurospora crassa OR74A]